MSSTLFVYFIMISGSGMQFVIKAWCFSLLRNVFSRQRRLFDIHSYRKFGHRTNCAIRSNWLIEVCSESNLNITYTTFKSYITNMLLYVLKLYWKEKETHIHFEYYLYQRCIVCVNESVFENIHIWAHCDTFHCKQTMRVSCVNGKSYRGNANKIQALCNTRKNWFVKCSSFWQYLV